MKRRSSLRLWTPQVCELLSGRLGAEHPWVVLMRSTPTRTAGVILRAGTWIYLRPQQVVETVVRQVPHTAEQLKERIKVN